MISKDVDYHIRRMMEEAGLDVSYDQTEFPPLDAALRSVKKPVQDTVDAFAVVDDCLVIVENRLGTCNQVEWGLMQSPFSSPIPVIDNNLVAEGKAENGTIQHLRVLANALDPATSSIRSILALGCSMDQDGSFIIRPYFSQVGGKDVVRLPPLDDFSPLSLRNIGDYILRCRRLVKWHNDSRLNLSREVEDLRDKLRKWRVSDEKLVSLVAVVLLAMGNPRFARTRTQDATDSTTVRECALSWVQGGDPYTMISREPREIVKDRIKTLTATGRIGITNVKGITRFIDTEQFIPVEQYSRLFDSMVMDADLPYRAQMMASLLDPKGTGMILDPHCRNGAAIGLCARRAGSSGHNVIAVCDVEDNTFNTVVGLLLHGLIFITVEEPRQFRQRFIESKKRARHIVSDLVGQGDEVDLMYRSMDLGSSGCTAVFCLSADALSDDTATAREIRERIASRWTIESIVSWKDYLLIKIKKNRNKNGTGTKFYRFRNSSAETVLDAIESSGRIISFTKVITDDDWSL